MITRLQDNFRFWLPGICKEVVIEKYFKREWFYPKLLNEPSSREFVTIVIKWRALPSIIWFDYFKGNLAVWRFVCVTACLLYPVWPRMVAWCSGPLPLLSVWLTLAPFCSKNSQAARAFWSKEKEAPVFIFIFIALSKQFNVKKQKTTYIYVFIAGDI